jgi:DNA-binding CsgD family transcriptional regulator
MYSDACIPYFMTGDIERLQAAVRRGYELAGRVGGVTQLVAAVALAGGRTLAGDRAEATTLLRDCHDELMAADPLVRAQDLCHAALTWIWLEGFDRAQELLGRVVAAARSAGALGVLPQALGIESELHFRVGRWHDARVSAAESLRLASETRQANLYGMFFAGRLDAVQGRDEECRQQVSRTMEVAERLGVACMALYTGHELGLLALSRGDAGEAIARLEAVRELPVVAHIHEPAVVPWIFDLVEAYIRDGRTDAARELLAAHEPQPGGQWAAAAAARCRALLAAPEEMGEAFAVALAAPGCALMPFERARTQLCYGERLRRARRRADARRHLHDALETFNRLGAQPWAERVRTELRATGSTVGRSPDALPRLTPQELQVALVVARGATNHEAAATLFMSQKTIEYHLSNIYRKTHIRSRAELAGIAGDVERGPGRPPSERSAIGEFAAARVSPRRRALLTDPEAAKRELAQRLTFAYWNAGKPSLAVLSESVRFSKVALSNVFAGRTLPTWPLITGLAAELLVPDETVTREWFDLWTAASALRSEREAVAEAAAVGSVSGTAAPTPDEAGYTCTQCGSWVVNTVVHTSWHMRNEGTGRSAPAIESLAEAWPAGIELGLIREAFGVAEHDPHGGQR